MSIFICAKIIVACAMAALCTACQSICSKPYEEHRVVHVPGTPHTIEFTRVDGGTVFIDGRRVDVKPFWISTHEVAWAHYEPFPQSASAVHFAVREGVVDPPAEAMAAKLDLPWHPLGQQWWLQSLITDSSPTIWHPASNITPYGAVQYSRWLSWLSGEDIRLPTYNEWSYIRAQLLQRPLMDVEASKSFSEIAVYRSETHLPDRPAVIKSRSPSRLGLYDFFGNVGEWVVALESDGTAVAVLMGGSWDDTLQQCIKCEGAQEVAAWKSEDPEVPPSKWYYSASLEGHRMGFRLVIADDTSDGWWGRIEKKLSKGDGLRRFDSRLSDWERKHLPPMLIKSLNAVHFENSWKQPRSEFYSDLK